MLWQVEMLYLAVLTADSMGTLSSSSQGAVFGITAGVGALLHKQGMCSKISQHVKRKHLSCRKKPTDLLLSAVALLSFLQVTVSTVLPSIH